MLLLLLRKSTCFEKRHLAVARCRTRKDSLAHGTALLFNAGQTEATENLLTTCKDCILVLLCGNQQLILVMTTIVPVQIPGIVPRTSGLAPHDSTKCDHKSILRNVS